MKMKMSRYIVSAMVAVIWLICFNDTLYAALSAPVLSVETDNRNVTASWSSTDNPEGYILLLAPYPDATTLYEVDMGSQTTITAELWDSAAFYIAIQAYDSTGKSDFSNVEYFIITESEDDESDSSEATRIVLQGDSIAVTGTGATADGSQVTISSAGTYSISGTLTNGQIVVETEDEESVNLILNGVSITNSTSAPIYVMSAENTVITLADNTVNSITDGTLYTFEDPEEDEPDAAIFSKSDLTINGNGSLSVDANYNDGIKSKDELIISSGTITVDSVDDGIIGKDSISLQGGTVVVNAGGDGLKSTNDEDTSKGYIAIDAGVLKITSGSDAIQAETSVTITNGEFNLYAGGGSSAMLSDAEASAKGIKASVSITVDSGFITIDSADDALNSNQSIVVNGGNFVISSGDDAFHADSTLTVNGGEIDITKSYEGIESAVITINDGDIHIVSSDDGLNVAGGNDSSGDIVRPFGEVSLSIAGETISGSVDQTVTGGGGSVWPGQDVFDTLSDYYLYINGGYIVVDAAGDGIDVNGSIEMKSGVVIVNGPTDSGNGPIDIGDGGSNYFKISGGFLVAAGSSGMAVGNSTSSTQYGVLVNLSSSQSAGNIFHLETSSGTDLLTYKPAKKYQSVFFSSPDLGTGSHVVYLGGSCSGTLTDNLYTGGTYTPGTQYTTFSVSSTSTKVGSGGGPGF